MTFREYGEKWGVDPQAVLAQYKTWVCNEGYDSNGEEYTLMEWLDTFVRHSRAPKRCPRFEDRTPWQKGDDLGF
jgi:hypothetical protein